MRAINTFLTLKILANCQMSTGSLMTRQTYDRAPRLTKLATAHISKGVIRRANMNTFLRRRSQIEFFVRFEADISLKCLQYDHHVYDVVCQ